MTAAAIIALLGSAAALLAWVSFLYGLSRLRGPNGESAFDTFSLFVILIAVIPPVLALLGFQTSVGLLRLDAWARKSAMIWAGVSLTFCLALVARYPYEIFAIDNQHFVGERAMFRQFLAQALLILLVPTNIWWLILFTRKSVKAQFQPTESTVSSASD